MIGGLAQWFENRRMKRYRFDRGDWERAVVDWPPAERFRGALRDQLFDTVKRFLLRKSIVGGAGFKVTDAMRWKVATMACVPILHRGLDLYAGWAVVVLYETAFLPEHAEQDDMGVVHEGGDWLSGEAWEQGPVILSWEDVRAAAADPPYNVVIHEMAHKIDMRSGAANGAPPLPDGMSARRWYDTFTAARAELSAWEAAGQETLVDPYALSSPAEFFAVVSECFFEAPDALCALWPDLFGQLAQCYGMDPRSGGPWPHREGGTR